MSHDALKLWETAIVIATLTVSVVIAIAMASLMSKILSLQN